MSENVARQDENAFTERKRKRENALMALIRIFRTKTCFPSENVALKTKNAITERKRHTQMRKRVFRPEMSLSKYIFAFARDFFARLCCFCSIDAFSPLQTLFSLGKSVFAFAIEVYARWKRFRVCERRLRSVKAFPPFRARKKRFGLYVRRFV